MSVATNRRWLLNAYPQGVPRAGDFSLVTESCAEPGEGCVRVRVLYLSMDPAPRMRMDPRPRMGPPLGLGDVVIGRGAGIVETSAAADCRVGDFVTGELGWQEYAVVKAGALARVEPGEVGLAAHLGILASSGLTAYLLVEDCARARSGETVVIAAAAGSVGLAACQIAMLRGCRVVALAHGATQARFIREQIAPAAVVDDTDLEALARALDAACPRGVDVFLDSVGGPLHDAVMERIAVHGRAVCFGFISAYNAAAGAERPYGRIYEVIKRRATVMGFLLGDHVDRFPAVVAQLSQWLRDGLLRPFDHVTDGFEAIPGAFAALFGEAAPGKHLVRLVPENP